MTIKRVTDDTIRLQLEYDLEYLNDLYLALLTPRKTEPQRVMLKQHAFELKDAVPELTDPEPPKPPAAKSPAQATKAGDDKGKTEEK